MGVALSVFYESCPETHRAFRPAHEYSEPLASAESVQIVWYWKVLERCT